MSIPKASSRLSVALVLLFAIWLLSLLDALHAGRFRNIIDEAAHVPQIESFLKGHFVIEPHLTMIPGYHLAMAGLMKITGLQSLSGMRAINALLGLIAVAFFYFIRRSVDDTRALKHAAMFLFLPLLYSYYFLIYTDTLSLALVLAALLANLKGRHMLAAAALLLSVLVRQNNVVWAGFLAAFAAWPALRESRWRLRPCLSDVLRIVPPYILPIIVFLVYWAWNGSISLSKGEATAHPDLTLHRGNLSFFLLLCLILFPHRIWAGARRFCVAVRTRPWLIVAPLIALLFAKLDGFGFGPGGIQTSYFIHNRIIEAINADRAYQVMFRLAVALAACGLLFTRFVQPQAWLVYPFCAFYLSSSWLIENRYSIIPAALWMALQKNEDEKAEIYVLLAWVIVSVYLTHKVLHGRYML